MADRMCKAGRKGCAITFVSEEDARYFPDLLKALDFSEQCFLDDLKALADGLMAEVSDGIEQAHRTGYGNSGLKFNEEEDEDTMVIPNNEWLVALPSVLGLAIRAVVPAVTGAGLPVGGNDEAAGATAWGPLGQSRRCFQPVSTKGKPTKLHKRKHQIGSLYFDMRQKEMELAERRAKGFLTKAQTQAKYGW
ncbi:hypothetical protein OROMI_011134 [Orobanche minor]